MLRADLKGGCEEGECGRVTKASLVVAADRKLPVAA